MSILPGHRSSDPSIPRRHLSNRGTLDPDTNPARSMASGRAQDRATRWLALPFGLLCWPWLGAVAAAWGGLAFLVGGLWLSPDLNTRSNPTRRWGPLRLLW